MYVTRAFYTNKDPSTEGACVSVCVCVCVCVTPPIKHSLRWQAPNQWFHVIFHYFLLISRFFLYVCHRSILHKQEPIKRSQAPLIKHNLRWQAPNQCENCNLLFFIWAHFVLFSCIFICIHAYTYWITPHIICQTKQVPWRLVGLGCL